MADSTGSAAVGTDAIFACHTLIARELLSKYVRQICPQARRHAVTMVSEAESAQPGSLRITRPGGQAVRARATTIPAVGKRRLQRSAIHDAEGSACGVLRKDFPSP